jgi:plasmid maintenance system antidote protein VapI
MENITVCTLLDYLITRYKLKNDAALARFLDLPPPVISKMRHGKTGFSAENIIRVHKKTSLSIAAIEAKLPPVKNIA